MALDRANSREVNQPVWVGHSCPTLLTLVLPLLLVLVLPMWVGHSCPTLLTLVLILGLTLPLMLKRQVAGSDTAVRRF